jgi:3-oxoacyl-[acyl-carrier-protein] synthase-3
VTLPAVGLRSLAVHLPRAVRTNDYWRERHPEMVRGVADQNLARVWSPPPGASVSESAFLSAMAPYMSDPFRGAKERRILGADESTLSMELPAARGALDAAKMAPDDVDLVISSAFLPDQIGVGNAAFLAKALGVRCPAWNLETACTSSLVALETAGALVATGAYARVLVVISCSYSKTSPETDTLAWANGDGAAAFVVGRVPDGEGVLGVKTINTADGCGAMYYELVGGDAGPHIEMRAGKEAGAALRHTSERALLECSRGAMRAAGVTLDDIDFFVVPTPVAWYADFCARLLGFAPEKTINLHPRFANMGPALMPTNLYFAAREGKVRPGSLVLLHTVGIVSNASAAVVRWGDVGLGPVP